MPLIEFDDSNRKVAEKFPKIFLDKDGRARIGIISNPHVEYVHTLKAPKIKDGKAVQITKQRKNGDAYLDFDMDFIGNPLCLGDYTVLEDRGVDPDNCPACKIATEVEQTLPPKRRFAMPVVKYVNLKANSFEIANPFAVQIVVWTFTDDRYNKILELKNSWGLADHDLLLGPCSDKTFQKYDISIGNKAEWKVDAARKQQVKDAISEQDPGDLSTFCGRKVIAKYMEVDIEKVLKRWRQVNGTEPTSDPLTKTESLSKGLETLGLGSFGQSEVDSSEPETTSGVSDDAEVDLQSILDSL